MHPIGDLLAEEKTNSSKFFSLLVENVVDLKETAFKIFTFSRLFLRDLRQSKSFLKFYSRFQPTWLADRITYPSNKYRHDFAI
jgi:hypothetical protein